MAKPEAPTPPDPYAVAGAQGQMNTQSAIGSTMLNMPNVSGPGGTVTYPTTDSYTMPDGTVVPRFTQVTTLSPEQQQLYDQSTQLQSQALGTGSQAINNVASTINSPFNLEGLPSLMGETSDVNIPLQSSFGNPSQQMTMGPTDFSADRQQTQDALMSRFNEDIAKREQDVQAQMNAQGLQLGSEAYGDAMSQIDRAKNDALSQAILGSGAEQQRMFEMAMGQGQFANQAAAQQFAQNQSAAGFNNAAAQQMFGNYLSEAQLSNAARSQGVSEQALTRSQPLNEFATLFGLGSQLQVPQATSGAGFGVNPADLLGATSLQYNVLNNNYSQQMQNQAALGGIFGNLGAAGILASDLRVKDIHRRIGQTDTGIPLYLFSYKNDPKVHVGVIAQEARETIPEAVHDIGGVLHVNYGRL